MINLLYVSTRFEHYVLIIRRSKLYYTASDYHHAGGRPVHRLREDWLCSAHRTATYSLMIPDAV